MGIKIAFLIPPLHTFVTHDETYQAKCNKPSNEQTEKMSNVYHIRQMKLSAANWTDLTIYNKLSNKKNHVMCNK